MKIFRSVLGVAVQLGFLTTGCVSDYSFAPLPSSMGQSRSTSASTQPGPSPSPSPSSGAAKVFQTLQPAIAVRGGSCLACHANVQSPLVTDFGYSDPFFLDPGEDQVDFASFYFNHELNTWQSSTIVGQLVVPKASLDPVLNSRQWNTVDPQHSMGTMSLAQFVRLPVVSDENGNSLGGGYTPLASGFTPNGDLPSVLEKSSIYIGAPVPSDILSLAPSLSLVSTGFTALETSQSVRGLNIVGGGFSAYVTNTGPFICYGDVVIKGTLFLNAPNIETDGSGCRLYVSGTVFLQGQTVFQGAAAGATNNLQITSSSAIMVGFDTSTLPERLMIGGDRTEMLPGAMTRGAPDANSILAKHLGIFDEAVNISGLLDAGNPASPPVNFTHILLNAPEVHSHYSSSFNGAVIGELVLFTLGQFSFTFDPVFESVPILPALQVDVLRIVD